MKFELVKRLVKVDDGEYRFNWEVWYQEPNPRLPESDWMYAFGAQFSNRAEVDGFMQEFAETYERSDIEYASSNLGSNPG